MIGTLREKLLADKKLRKAAKVDGQQIFEKNVFPKVFNDTAQASYIESTETYTKLFEDGAKYRAIMTALAQELYREMRNEREDDHAKAKKDGQHLNCYIDRVSAKGGGLRRRERTDADHGC